MISSALAQASTPEFDVDKFINLISAFLEAPTWKAIVMIIGIIALCLVYITKYFYDRNKREREAYELSQKIRKRQEENLARMQVDATNALIENMDMSYKQDFEYFTKKIEEKNYKAVYAKMSSVFHTGVSDIIYDEKESAESRAARIIHYVKNKSMTMN